MMTKKYEFVYSDTVEIGGRKTKLTRIRALRPIFRHNIKAGDLGGYLESGQNLSHEGDCWVGGNAKVYTYGHENDSVVSGNALVTDNAQVYGSTIKNHAVVCNNASVVFSTISENAKVTGKASVKHDSHVSGVAEVIDESCICYSGIYDSASVSGKSYIRKCVVKNNSRVTGESKLENCQVNNDTVIEDKEFKDVFIDKTPSVGKSLMIAGVIFVGASVAMSSLLGTIAAGVIAFIAYVAMQLQTYKTVASD